MSVSVENLQRAVEDTFGPPSVMSLGEDKCRKILQSFQQRMCNELLQMKKDVLADDAAFYQLGKLLQGVGILSYEDFLRTKNSNSCPPSLRKYFTPRTFLSLARDESGCIAREDFMRFVQRTIDVEAVTVGLLRHTVCDEDVSGPASGDPGGSWSVNGLSGKGGNLCFITEQELERFVFELIPSIPGCKELDIRFYPFYVYTASRYFLFYLDPRHTKRVNIRRLSHSYVMEELLYFKRISQFENDTSPAIFASQASNNWFDAKNAERLYNTYVDLDTDGNGTLSQDELFQFCGVRESESVQLSRTVIRRIFEEYISYQPSELDYKAFVDLVIALDNKRCPESMAYFWRLLDVNKTGRLGQETINLFYRDIHESLHANGYDAPSPANVAVEVYDLLGCEDPRGPSFKELVASGQGHVAISMLVDETGFWQYDNRESHIAQSVP